MATQKPARRRVIKTTLILDVDLHARWAVAASLAGMDRSAWAVSVLRRELKGVVIIDRRRPDPAGHAELPDGVIGGDSAA